MDLIKTLAAQFNLPLQSVKNTIELLESDNTIPFIARYRKEVTGNLDEVQIRNIHEARTRLIALENRRETILKSIQTQGLLTEVLEAALLNATTQTQLEDIYRPYRPKRRTKASIAREKGLGKLADMILEQIVTRKSLDSIVHPFMNDEVPDLDEALQGAADIAAEVISDNTVIRQITREDCLRYGALTSSLRSNSSDDRNSYQSYYEFKLPVRFLKPHQVLAINRGEKEGVLQVNLQINDTVWQRAVQAQYPFNRKSLFYGTLESAARDSAQRLLLPSIERDIRRMLTEQADEHAIQVFAKNLKALLTQPPLAGYIVLGIDPGFRTGSKVAVVDPTGKLLDTTTIYPHPPQNKLQESQQSINRLIDKYQVTLIVIGNGTASRETELFVGELIKHREGIHYIITSEAGASVYSASDLARKEFPDLDVSMRGAISIARRIQDPLAELVKIDPKSIGVGLYQHDVNQPKLSEALDQVVESVVNEIGVEVNTASAPLLSFVAGIGPSLGEKIVQFREENGPFKNREMLKRVPHLGLKTFEQCAGFLRIRNSTNPLDTTAIHPESYPIAIELMRLLNITIKSTSNVRLAAVETFKNSQNLIDLAKKLDIGLPTLQDILDEISRPGRDPRESLPKPMLRKDVLGMDDLGQGMELMGTIRNVVDFGAFIDIGVKTDGLLHQSKIKQGSHLTVGETIKVIILEIDKERGRISLGMIESTHS